MNFDHEIPSPVVAQKEIRDHDEHSLLIRFTEEEEFAQHIVETDVHTLEEDSDDEVCQVEDGYVTEEMLAEQDSSMTRLPVLLMEGAHTDINVCSVSSMKLPSLHFAC